MSAQKSSTFSPRFSAGLFARTKPHPLAAEYGLRSIAITLPK
jgi:hypothetical protein